jgi:hypothetical protein
MTRNGPRYSKEEFARRGDEIFERTVRPRLRPEDDGRCVAIDIETEEYCIADEILLATDELRRRLPDPQPWLIRIGRRYVVRFGFGRRGRAVAP